VCYYGLYLRIRRLGVRLLSGAPIFSTIYPLTHTATIELYVLADPMRTPDNPFPGWRSFVTVAAGKRDDPLRPFPIRLAPRGARALARLTSPRTGILTKATSQPARGVHRTTRLLGESHRTRTGGRISFLTLPNRSRFSRFADAARPRQSAQPMPAFSATKGLL
jgi:hypothetical protein